MLQPGPDPRKPVAAAPSGMVADCPRRDAVTRGRPYRSLQR